MVSGDEQEQGLKAASKTPPRKRTRTKTGDELPKKRRGGLLAAIQKYVAARPQDPLIQGILPSIDTTRPEHTRTTEAMPEAAAAAGPEHGSTSQVSTPSSSKPRQPPPARQRPPAPQPQQLKKQQAAQRRRKKRQQSEETEEEEQAQAGEGEMEGEEEMGGQGQEKDVLQHVLPMVVPSLGAPNLYMEQPRVSVNDVLVKLGAAQQSEAADVTVLPVGSWPGSSGAPTDPGLASPKLREHAGWEAALSSAAASAIPRVVTNMPVCQATAHPSAPAPPGAASAGASPPPAPVVRHPSAGSTKIKLNLLSLLRVQSFESDTQTGASGGHSDSGGSWQAELALSAKEEQQANRLRTVPQLRSPPQAPATEQQARRRRRRTAAELSSAHVGMAGAGSRLSTRPSDASAAASNLASFMRGLHDPAPSSSMAAQFSAQLSPRLRAPLPPLHHSMRGQPQQGQHANQQLALRALGMLDETPQAMHMLGPAAPGPAEGSSPMLTPLALMLMDIDHSTGTAGTAGGPAGTSPSPQASLSSGGWAPMLASASDGAAGAAGGCTGGQTQTPGAAVLAALLPAGMAADEADAAALEEMLQRVDFSIESLLGSLPATPAPAATALGPVVSLPASTGPARPASAAGPGPGLLPVFRMGTLGAMRMGSSAASKPAGGTAGTAGAAGYRGQDPYGQVSLAQCPLLSLLLGGGLVTAGTPPSHTASLLSPPRQQGQQAQRVPVTPKGPQQSAPSGLQPKARASLGSPSQGLMSPTALADWLT